MRRINPKCIITNDFETDFLTAYPNFKRSLSRSKKREENAARQQERSAKYAIEYSINSSRMQ